MFPVQLVYTRLSDCSSMLNKEGERKRERERKRRLTYYADEEAELRHCCWLKKEEMIVVGFNKL